MTNNKFKITGNTYSSEIYAKTKKYQKIYGFEIGTGEHDTWNNEADAFKHTFGSVDLALSNGTHVSKAFGDYHEWQGRKDMGQEPGEENMDKWNNAVGREIAREIRAEIWNKLTTKAELDDIIAEKVMHRMRKGELITHPNDIRKYVEPKTSSQKFNDKIRAKVLGMRDERNRRILGKNHPSNYGKSGNGHWVTIKGAHVFIED